jgi:hypothetical protein
MADGVARMAAPSVYGIVSPVQGNWLMSKITWILIAVGGLVAGCSGAPPGSAAARSESLADQCAVCQMENPGYAGSGVANPCAQVCVASGQWVQYGPGPPGPPGR